MGDMAEDEVNAGEAIWSLDEIARREGPWSFTVPGRAPSVNHMYLAGRTYGSRRKAPGVEAWQAQVSLIVKSARPSGWVATGQVRLVFDFYLSRDADCDNLLKAIQDAIAPALGVNDSIFLPCVRSKTKVPTKQERIEVTVSNAEPS
jgi:Holliday junction resolvase RusA-like endonuclease